jgi:hypothetical protein
MGAAIRLAQRRGGGSTVGARAEGDLQRAQSGAVSKKSVVLPTTRKRHQRSAVVL